MKNNIILNLVINFHHMLKVVIKTLTSSKEKEVSPNYLVLFLTYFCKRLNKSFDIYSRKPNHIYIMEPQLVSSNLGNKNRLLPLRGKKQTQKVQKHIVSQFKDFSFLKRS
jgi:hypothetical protein